ncbi:hypothetical protein DMP23_09560 [Amycolatopsis sp. A1MSW2902]
MISRGAVEAVPRGPVSQRRRIEPVPGEHDQPQRAGRPAGLGVGPVELGERGRGLAQDGDPFAQDEVVQRARLAGGPVRHHDKSAAMGESAPDLPDAVVEGDRMAEGPHVLAVEREPPAARGEQAQHVPVGDPDSLGFPGGPGGVEHVSQTVRGTGLARRGSVHNGRFGDILDKERRDVAGAPAHGVPLRQHEDWSGIVDEIGEAFLRQRRIQRYVGRARLQDRDDRHNDPLGAAEAQTHETARGHPAHEARPRGDRTRGPARRR